MEQTRDRNEDKDFSREVVVRGREKYGGYEFEALFSFFSFEMASEALEFLIHLLMNAEVSGSILGFSFHNFLIGLMAFVSICLFVFLLSPQFCIVQLFLF